MSKEKKDKLPIYGSEQPAEVRYDVARLPLQDQVAGVRKALCVIWRDTKSQWRRMEDGLALSVGRAKSRTSDALQSVGIKDPMLVAKVTAVGSAGLVGLLAARRKSLFFRVLYTSLAASLVGAPLYFMTHKDKLREVKGHLDFIPHRLGSNRGREVTSGQSQDSKETPR